MTLKHHNPGARMSEAVIHGDTVYLSGQVGNPDADLATQTQDCLDKIDRILSEVGSSKSKAVRVVIWLADMADFAAMNAVYDAWIDPDCPPTRACGEAKLATPKHLVEFTVVAAL